MPSWEGGVPKSTAYIYMQILMCPNTDIFSLEVSKIAQYISRDHFFGPD